MRIWKTTTAFGSGFFVPIPKLSAELERFPTKWVPVGRKKTRQINNLEQANDSICSQSALVGSGLRFAQPSATRWLHTNGGQRNWDSPARA